MYYSNLLLQIIYKEVTISFVNGENEGQGSLEANQCHKIYKSQVGNVAQTL